MPPGVCSISSKHPLNGGMISCRPKASDIVRSIACGRMSWSALEYEEDLEVMLDDNYIGLR